MVKQIMFICQFFLRPVAMNNLVKCWCQTRKTVKRKKESSTHYNDPAVCVRQSQDSGTDKPEHAAWFAGRTKADFEKIAWKD
jgi:hypothetical protein